MPSSMVWARGEPGEDEKRGGEKRRREGKKRDTKERQRRGGEEKREEMREEASMDENTREEENDRFEKRCDRRCHGLTLGDSDADKVHDLSSSFVKQKLAKRENCAQFYYRIFLLYQRSSLLK